MIYQKTLGKKVYFRDSMTEQVTEMKQRGDSSTEREGELKISILF